MLLPDGTFVFDLRLSEGRNKDTIRVIDPAGNDLTVEHYITYYRLISPATQLGLLVLTIIFVSVVICLMIYRKRRKGARNE
jgi:cbb3-type cytochrome oxidase subunit 3